MKNWLIKTNQE